MCFPESSFGHRESPFFVLKTPRWQFCCISLRRGHCVSVCFFLIFLMFIFETETETKCEWGRGRGRGRHRIRSRLQSPSCQHRAWRGTRTRKLGDHDLSWSQLLNQLSRPGAPCLYLYFSSSFSLSPQILVYSSNVSSRFSKPNLWALRTWEMELRETTH